MSGSMVEPFDVYQPLFWQVFAELAAHGTVVPPDEAVSLIGLFQAGSWEQLRRTYDPGRGSFRAYLSRAFYRFARREILRQQDRRLWLADVARLDLRVGPGPDPAGEAERREELATLGEALDRLPEGRRDLLLAFLASDRVSERDMARAFKLTRHRVREELTDALGQIVTDLGHRWPNFPSDDRVAQSLWRNGGTVGDAARWLGLTAADVRASRTRIFHRLVAMVRGRLPEELSRKGMTMSTPNAEAELALFKECLLYPNSPELLNSVRTRAREILDAMEDAEETDFALTADEAKEITGNPEWAAKVYGALDLGGEVEGEESVERAEVRRAIEALRNDEATMVADAFEQLMETLDPEFRDLGRWFPPTSRANRDEINRLESDPDVREGGEHARQLVLYGLTPLTVASAAGGVQLLVDRVIDQAKTDPERWPKHPVMTPLWSAVGDRMKGESRPSVDLMLGPTTGEEETAIPDALMIGQVRGTPGCPPEAAEPLLRWMTAIAPVRPFFFPGYLAEMSPTGQTLRLAQEPTASSEDILTRWSRRLAYS